MPQNDELAKIKAKIRAYSQRTIANGFSEAEAITTAEYLGRLLDQYNLTMDEVDLRDEPCVSRKVVKERATRDPLSAALITLGRFCDVIYYRNSRMKPGFTMARRKKKLVPVRRQVIEGYTVFGHETDTDTFVYLAEVMDRALATETKAFKKSDLYRKSMQRRTESTSFIHGFANRMTERLAEMHTAREEEMRKVRPTGTDLIVLKGKLIEAELDKTGVKLRTSTSRYFANSSRAISAGAAAAARVNLNPPITGPNGAAPLAITYRG